MIQSATRIDRAKCPRRPLKSHQIGGFHSTTPKKYGIHARRCHALETHMYITHGLGHNDTLTLSDSAQTYVSFTKKRGSISDPLYLVAIFIDELCQLACSVADDNRNHYWLVSVFLCKCRLSLLDECIVELCLHEVDRAAAEAATHDT